MQALLEQPKACSAFGNFSHDAVCGSLLRTAMQSSRQAICQVTTTYTLLVQVNTATQSLETNIFGLQPPPRGVDHAAALLLPGTGELMVAVSNATMQLYDLQRDQHVGLLQVHVVAPFLEILTSASFAHWLANVPGSGLYMGRCPISNAKP